MIIVTQLHLVSSFLSLAHPIVCCLAKNNKSGSSTIHSQLSVNDDNKTSLLLGEIDISLLPSDPIISTDIEEKEEIFKETLIKNKREVLEISDAIRKRGCYMCRSKPKISLRENVVQQQIELVKE